MKVNKREASILREAIKEWVRSGKLSAEQASSLEEELNVQKFDWQTLSYYAFLASLFAAILAALVFLADDWVWKVFDKALETPEWLRSLFFLSLAGLFYVLAYRKRKQSKGRVYSTEFLLLLGALGTAVSVMYLGRSLGIGASNNFPILVLFLSGLFGVLSLGFPSSMLWGLMLLALAVWFGTATGYASGWEDFFLGLNYPLRFSLFGLGLTLFGGFQHKWKLVGAFAPITQIIGVSSTFVALWLLSIFGNCGNMEAWYQLSQATFLPWSGLLLVASGLAVWGGIRTEHSMMRDIGAVFIFINLYTRYVEYGWDTMDRSLFFTILAISFWGVGRLSERVWSRWRAQEKNQ